MGRGVSQIVGQFCRLFLFSSFILISADVIGDGLSSKSSNEEFFSSLDANLDGTVEESEIQQLVSGFGGGSLDEPEEIKRSVRNVFAQLDTNQDGTLTVAESHSFWRHLGTLLTVDEVAAWVVHGIQMPDSIGQIFRDNGVSGYDFAELLEDDGDALEEIGITKSVHKKKLVRSIKMLMSGVGISPTVPTSPIVKGMSCQSVRLSWNPSDGGGFPIHKYRVYRHASNHHHHHQNNNDSIKQMHENQSEVHHQSKDLVGANTMTYRSGRGSDWILVYDGPQTSFTDTIMSGSISGGAQAYECEAWSLFGHSEPLSFTGSAWTVDKETSQPCEPQPQQQSHHPMITPSSSLSSSSSSMAGGHSVGHSVGLPWDSSQSSIPTSLSPPPPNSVITSPHSLPLLPLPPKNMSIRNKEYLLNSNSNHSNHSYIFLIKKLFLTILYNLWWLLVFLWNPFVYLLTYLSPLFGFVTALMRIRRGSLNPSNTSRKSSYLLDPKTSNGRLNGEIISWRVLAIISSIIPGANHFIPQSLRSDPSLSDYTIRNDGSASPAAVGTAGIKNARPPEMMNGKSSNYSNSFSSSSNVQDVSRCYTCKKRFNTFGGMIKKRSKHTCSSCWTLFCGTCGYSNHHWLLTCPVAGGCLCPTCSKSQSSLETDKIRNNKNNKNIKNNHKNDSNEKKTNNLLLNETEKETSKNEYPINKPFSKETPSFPPAPILKTPIPSIRPSTFGRASSFSPMISSQSWNNKNEKDQEKEESECSGNHGARSRADSENGYLSSFK